LQVALKTSFKEIALALVKLTAPVDDIEDVALPPVVAIEVGTN
jgi:hypothetical protein